MTELDFIPPAVIYDHMFIHYDDSGAVHLISNVESQDKNNFRIRLDLIEDFLAGRRQCKKFKIEFFFNLSKGIITSEEQIVSTNEKGLHLIPATDAYHNEVTIEHCADEWNIVVNETAKDVLGIIKSLIFFVVEKNNPYHMYKNITVGVDDLKEGNARIKFTISQEANLDLISLVTQKKFKSYGIKELA